MKKLLFGTAGIPLSTPERSTVSGIKQVKSLGLDCMELEFVHGVQMGKKTALQVRKAAEKQGIELTAHGPYYINLNSDNPAVVKKSRKRIIKTARIAELCGARSVTFHAAFYLGRNPETVTRRVKDELESIAGQVDMEIRPELTGKPSQWGSLRELVEISKIECVSPCIDYAHYVARSCGKNNNIESFRTLLEKVETVSDINNMHIHIAGIEFGDKGETRHKNIEDSDIDIRSVVQTWREFNVKGIVICESPNIEKDALFVKELVE